MKDTQLTDILTKLFIEYKEKFDFYPDKGQVVSYTHSHYFCDKLKKTTILTLPEIFLQETINVKNLRIFTNLLLSNAIFYIIHDSKKNDIYVIEWTN